MKENNSAQKAPIVPVASKKKTIKEYKLSWAGKLFFAAAAGYILSNSSTPTNIPIKIRGSKEQMKTIINAIVSSKKFQQELKKPGATVESVIDKLRIRNISKQQYKNLTGLNWPI